MNGSEASMLNLNLTSRRLLTTDIFRSGQLQHYHRFNPPQGLGDIELADYRQEATISSVTDAWLKSPDGRAAISSATEKIKVMEGSSLFRKGCHADAARTTGSSQTKAGEDSSKWL